MAREQARKYGTGFEVVEDMDEAFKDADIVYPKSWGPLVYTEDVAESAQDHQQVQETGSPMSGA